MPIKSIMSKTIATIGMDDTLSVIKGIFDESKFHHLLVVEEGKLFGVVSDRDLFKALGASLGTKSETLKDLATLNKKVHHIMTRKLITLKPNASIYKSIKVLNENNISCIPIVDDEFKPVGIVTRKDILNAIDIPDDE